MLMIVRLFIPLADDSVQFRISAPLAFGDYAKILTSKFIVHAVSCIPCVCWQQLDRAAPPGINPPVNQCNSDSQHHTADSDCNTKKSSSHCLSALSAVYIAKTVMNILKDGVFMQNEIAISKNNLPVNLSDLSKFVLIGREKLVAVRAEIRAIEKIGLAEEVHKQKLQEAQAISEAVLDAEVRIGQLMSQVEKKQGFRTDLQLVDSSVAKSNEQNNNPNGENQYVGQKGTAVASRNQKHDKAATVSAKQDDKIVTVEQKQPEKPVEVVTPKPQKTKAEIIKESGFTPKQVQRFQTLAANPEIVEQAKAEARENDDIVSRSLVLNMVRTKKKEEQLEQAKKHIIEQNKPTNAPVLHIGDGTKYTPAEKYDLLLTDPPYSTDIDDISEFVKSWLYHALDNVKPTGFAYVFIGAYPEELKAYLNAEIPEHMKLCQQLIWTYKNTLGNNPKDRYKQNYQVCLFYRGVNAPDLDCPLTSEQWAVQEINAPDGRQGDRYHAWQKPMEISERFIRHSTKQGFTVFDPFSCTGTFLLAAAKLGRKAYGFEINPDNAKIAFERGCVNAE